MESHGIRVHGQALYQCNQSLSTAGQGAITVNQMSLQSSSFQSNPPTFTLAGVTRGGPPTTYTWTRNGEVITDGGPYSISIAVTENNLVNRQFAIYTSTLRVTGNLPGLYQYSVTNRATATPMSRSFSIEGEESLALGCSVSIDMVGGSPTSLMAIQNGLDTVRVSWTAPPGGGRYRVTAVPGGMSVDSPASPLQALLLQPDVYGIRVETLSQHLPGGTVGPVEVTVRGEKIKYPVHYSFMSYNHRQFTTNYNVDTDCHISECILDPTSTQFHSS